MFFINNNNYNNNYNNNNVNINTNTFDKPNNDEVDKYDPIFNTFKPNNVGFLYIKHILHCIFKRRVFKIFNNK